MDLKSEKPESWRDLLPILLLFYIPPVGVIVMWLVAVRWSALTRWVVTILVGIVPLVVLGSYSYGGYKFAKFEQSYVPVLEVQQALDIYGIQNSKYPESLTELTPKYIKEVPTDKDLQYKLSDDSKSYTLQGKVEGKDVTLGPALNLNQ